VPCSLRIYAATSRVGLRASQARVPRAWRTRIERARGYVPRDNMYVCMYIVRGTQEQLPEDCGTQVCRYCAALELEGCIERGM
jgi:hypothetical protein